MKFLMIYLNTAVRNSFPVGVASLLTYLKNKGHNCEVFDTSFYKEFSKKHRDVKLVKLGLHKELENKIEIKMNNGDLLKDMERKIDEFKPDIIGISLLSVHYPLAIRISRHLKDYAPEIPIMFGGLHPTLMPEETIAEDSVDMLCVGEGELAITELFSKIIAGESIEKVENIWLKKDGEIFRNPMRPLVDLNELPTMDWDFFDIQHIYAPLNGRMRRIGSVEFSRGCPFSCSYCSANVIRDMVGSKNFLRRRNVDKIVEDLKILKNKYDIEMFYFLDESLLAMSTSILKEFAEAYKREVGIPFYGMTHPLTVTEEKVAILKDMGCYLMTIGIEQGNEEFRNKFLKRLGSNEDAVRCFDLFHKYGVHISAFAMIGLPDETREMTFETIELFRRCKPVTYSVGVYHPYVGSDLRTYCIDKGFFDPTDDPFDYPNGRSVLKMPQITPEEIEGLHKTFYIYTKVPKEYFPLVEMVERGEKNSELLRQILLEYIKMKEDKVSRVEVEGKIDENTLCGAGPRGLKDCSA